MIKTFKLLVNKEREWVHDDLYHIGFRVYDDDIDAAINNIKGSVLIALGQRTTLPDELTVKFKVVYEV